LREWVESTWVQLGGPACVPDDTALEDAAAYFELLEGLAEGADLADFDWFREQVNALFAQPTASAGEVLQLMTIHKAKGLEFDTVILPCLGSVTRSEDQHLLLWLEHRGELLLAPIAESGGGKDALYSYLDNIERRRADQETARLLYVAATRARRSLHLLASVAHPESRSFLKLLWPVVAGQFANVALPAQAQHAQRAKSLRRLPATWQAPASSAPVKWKHTGLERVERPEVAFDWVSDHSRYAGAALHGFLQEIARDGLAAWDESSVRSRPAAYRAVLANLGVPPGQLAWAADRVEAGLLRTLRDPRGRWILDHHTDAATELAIAGLLEGSLFEAVIDRTFIDEQGVRWIIDYKTSTHDGAGLENFLEQERERYREQLERYARLMVQREDRPIRLGLYFPLLGEWLEWAAPVVLRKQALLFEL
jgi:ATP-dependent exoDNAse (exonuclease V) beta subunit